MNTEQPAAAKRGSYASPQVATVGAWQTISVVAAARTLDNTGNGGSRLAPPAPSDDLKAQQTGALKDEAAPLYPDQWAVPADGLSAFYKMKKSEAEAASSGDDKRWV